VKTAMRRKNALKRLSGLALKVDEHVQKIAADPTSRDAPHWQKEVETWIQQMEAVLLDVGEKTADAWAARIGQWKQQMGT
jgi:hypothetical protein